MLKWHIDGILDRGGGDEMYVKTKLEDILELHRGYDLPECERAEGNIPIISSSGYSGVHNDFKCDGENVNVGR